jgi:hypothetical protein
MNERPLVRSQSQEAGRSSVSAATSPRSQVSCNVEDFGKALAYLTALKRTVELTEPQIMAWHAVLAGFPSTVINAAVIELCLTENRFPEVGDLYQICRRKMPKPYSPNGEGTDMKRPTVSEVKSIAERLGLPV